MPNTSRSTTTTFATSDITAESRSTTTAYNTLTAYATSNSTAESRSTGTSKSTSTAYNTTTSYNTTTTYNTSKSTGESRNTGTSRSTSTAFNTSTTTTYTSFLVRLDQLPLHLTLAKIQPLRLVQVKAQLQLITLVGIQLKVEAQQQYTQLILYLIQRLQLLLHLILAL